VWRDPDPAGRCAPPPGVRGVGYQPSM